MNPYLKRKREQYEALRSSISGIQAKATTENRDLTDDEMNLVRSQADEAKKVAADIELLTEQENRTAAVADMAAKLRATADGDDPAGTNGDTGGEPKNRSLGFVAKDRDPGLYTRTSGQSFFGDMLRAKVLGDEKSSERIRSHQTAQLSRTNQTTATIAGVVPPEWMVAEYTELAKQGRALANVVRSVTLTDPRPFTLPGQTASAVVGTQSAENDAITPGDAYDAAGVAISPITIVGQEVISRQLLDSSNPAIDSLILSDLVAAYNAKIENMVGASIRAIGSALTAANDDFADPTSADWGYNLTVDASMFVRKNRYRRATALVMTPDRYGEFLKLKDSAGRPVVVHPMTNAQNAIGVAGAAGVSDDGWIGGLPIVVSDGMIIPSSSNDAFAAIYAPDVVLFESNMFQFRYEEVAGPESIKLGLWAYAVSTVRQGTRSVKNVTVTPGS